MSHADELLVRFNLLRSTNSYDTRSALKLDLLEFYKTASHDGNLNILFMG